LKAIHNANSINPFSVLAVLDLPKLQFESNSQPDKPRINLGFWLCSICQSYNLKAIHNRRGVFLFPGRAVLDLPKLQFESNSQLQIYAGFFRFCCARFAKVTIWKQFTTEKKNGNFRTELCSICQSYNLKAIHNSFDIDHLPNNAVLDLPKLQFESNSQHIVLYTNLTSCCARFAKVTIWKQFTTK